MERKEAIEKVRKWNLPKETREILEALAPELKESEDERIRKHLVAIVEMYWGKTNDPDKAKELAYLERLKECVAGSSKTSADEDERMLEKIISYLEMIKMGCVICAIDTSEEIAWLGKRKGLDKMIVVSPEVWDNAISDAYENGKKDGEKQKPLSTEETELNSLAFLSQMGYTCIPPKKEHQNNSDAPKNALGGALNSPLDKDKNLDDIAQDYVEAVKEYNPEPTWDLMQTAVCYGYHYREEEEQKPVEFPLKDKVFSIMKKLHSLNFMLKLGSNEERLVNEITSEVRDLADYSIDKPAEWKDRPANWDEKKEAEYQYEMSFVPKPEKPAEWDKLQEEFRNINEAFEDGKKEVVAHPEKYGLCKPAEWSEEDENNIGWIVAFLQGEEGSSEMIELMKESLISWFKSLRPFWKPSEKDIKMLEHIIGQYETGNKNSKVMGYLPRVEELSFLKKVLAKWKN